MRYNRFVFPVRLARGRDEWESAMLQNDNTRCNGLIVTNMGTSGL